MTEKYKIIAKFVKDMSSETPDIDTYLFVKDNIKNYSLSIDIKSRALKDKIIQIEISIFGFCILSILPQPSMNVILMRRI